MGRAVLQYSHCTCDTVRARRSRRRRGAHKACRQQEGAGRTRRWAQARAVGERQQAQGLGAHGSRRGRGARGGGRVAAGAAGARGALGARQQGGRGARGVRPGRWARGQCAPERASWASWVLVHPAWFLT